jgi:tetratricopeptide (TPR) repeat protein
LTGSRKADDFIPIKKKNLFYFLSVCIFILYSVKTMSRNSDWKDHLTLYKHDMPWLSQSAKANVLYAGTLLDEVYSHVKIKEDVVIYKNEIETIIKHYQQAISLYPGYANAQNNLGSVYFILYGDFNKALPYFEKAVKLDSLYHEAMFNAGYCYELKKDTAKAEFWYRKAIAVKPDYVRALSNLANLQNARGFMQEAIEWNRKIMKADSTIALPYLNIGNYYLLKSDTLTAVKYWEQAVHKNPPNRELIMGIATYYRQHGNEEKAAYYYSFGGK